MNKITATDYLTIGGAFHVGVEVYGREWSYGWGKGTGVACSMPRIHPKHRFRCTVTLERTHLSDGDVAAIIGELVEMWPGEEYDWLHRNCCTFANAFTEALGVGRIPGWIDRFARGASAATTGAKTVLTAATTPSRLLAPVQNLTRTVLQGCGGPTLTRSLANAAKDSENYPDYPTIGHVHAVNWDSSSPQPPYDPHIPKTGPYAPYPQLPLYPIPPPPAPPKENSIFPAPVLPKENSVPPPPVPQKDDDGCTRL